ncbi:SAM-dependent methyltransferase, partial [Candidatus Woesebacteria bacterium]|nr:SAM-dependent methyltransferase [Candidatus Woesebacteria bacterium]
MFENFTFDTIYHEHLSYLAVRPLIKLFEPYGMEIFDVQTHPVQGVSLRVFAGNKGRHRILKSVQAFAKRELEMKMESFSTYLKLAKKIAAMKEDLRSLLISLKSKGKTIAAYGAPAKGNTLLNYFGIGEFLDYATEELPSKIGYFTPGTHLKVLDIKEARKAPPDYFLLLAWNYKEAILNKEREFRTKGGKFIMPVGRVEII